jgi:hypothetical protein
MHLEFVAVREGGQKEREFSVLGFVLHASTTR